MSGNVFIYDPNQVILVVGAIPIDSGFADDSMVKIERDSERFFIKRGVDGDITRSKSNNKLHMATIRLMQSSKFNDLLSSLVNLDDNSNNGAGVGAFLMQDLSGRALWAGSKAWVHKDPDVEMGADARPREWLIAVADMQRFDGGNYQV